MANVEHSTITDPNIHEPKGASTATSGQVYIANGSGSGTWTTLTSLITDNFSSKYLHVRTTNESVSSISENTWTQRTLSTAVTNEIPSASLASNQITLPAGTYWITAYVPVAVNMDSTDAEASINYKAKLRNATASSDLLGGSREFLYLNVEPGGGAESRATLRSFIVGRFTLGVSSALQIQSFFTDTETGGDSSVIVNTAATGNTSQIGSLDNITTDVHIWKVG